MLLSVSDTSWSTFNLYNHDSHFFCSTLSLSLSFSISFSHELNVYNRYNFLCLFYCLFSFFEAGFLFSIFFFFYQTFSDFPFSIDVHTGELFARGFIDRESRENYNFEVTVSYIQHQIHDDHPVRCMSCISCSQPSVKMSRKTFRISFLSLEGIKKNDTISSRVMIMTIIIFDMTLAANM